MKKIFFVLLLLGVFSSCVKNFGTGEPPYIMTNQEYNETDSILETDTFFLKIIIIEKNEADFEKLIFMTSLEDTLTYYESDLSEKDSLLIEYYPNIDIERDSVVEYTYKIYTKNDDSEWLLGPFYLIIKAQ